ncbi:P-loop containing nucleoside triphosphate hydrolase [Rhizophagus clarus]|nr:P-loop containing nucleoside triphosphate hydrolase [Rhizophagus clarus]
MTDTANKIIRRKSLGRVAFIGSLYNATRDTFCGTTIFKEKIPNDSINRVDIPNSELLFEYEDSYREKFNKLDVEAELKLSVLAGLFALEGSGKYLNDLKDSSRTVKGSLIYRMTLVEENLNICRDDVRSCISIDGFSNSDATHVVIGIKWGATLITSYERKNMKEADKHQVEATLKSYFENLSLSISGNGSVDVENNKPNLMNHFTIKLLGDAVPHNKTFLQSFDEAGKAMTDLPSYAKQSNDGKGFPIEYTLYPLSELAKKLSQNIKVNNLIMESSEETVLKIEQVFDDLFIPKQRLNDLFNDAKSISNIIPDNIFDDINNHVKDIKLEEAKFRKEFAESLVKMRTGINNIDELENIMTTFQRGVLSKSSIMTFVDQYRSISLKADLVLALREKKIEYLGKDSTIDHILRMNPKGHIYILVDEEIIRDNSSPVHNVFQDLYNSNEKSSKFFVVDPKICPEIKSPGYPVIHHYVNGRLESNDYYNANKTLFTSNLIKFDPQPHLKPKNDPVDKARLHVPCPQANCSTFCNWRCFKCQHEVEYGYNRHLYCGCGESSIDNCKFKCNNPLHTEGYISFDLNTLITLLPEEPPEEINILLLGETGVGKSTFINAFVNYLKFDTLNDAKEGNMEVLISSKFTLTDENYDTKTIKIGNNDDLNEKLENVGMSSTQECRTYVFPTVENKLIRLIDTPGIGDTRGLDQDKKNFENILKYISYHQYLNGICILLKPNNARLTIVFRFCIQELLSHLHRNAKDNIVFCFTNARGTFYRPGDTLPPLKEQLGDLKKRSNVEIKANKDTIYCFDNESFRFLAAIQKGINFEVTDKQNFAESWKKSVDESLRLIQYLVTRRPHVVKDTLSLNSSRNIVVLLSKPLAEIGQLIQTNIKLIKEQQNEIKNSDKTIEELKDQLYIPQVDLEPVSLGYPRTVCTSSGCVESLQIEQTNIKKINYIKHCHSHCYLNDVTCNEVNTAALRGCSAMNSDGTCNYCDCKWDKHMHITYENIQVTKKIIDKNVVLQISKKKSDQETKRAIIEDYQKRVNQLQKEQRTINEISLKFAQFLRQNAIAAFNDAYADYLDHFINEEKIKKSADPNRYDDEILKGLEATKRSYLEQIEVIKKAIENNDPSMPTISPNDVANLEQQLYNLPINGNTLKKIKDEAKRSQTSVFRYKESYYSRSINLISNTLARIFR